MLLGGRCGLLRSGLAGGRFSRWRLGGFLLRHRGLLRGGDFGFNFLLQVGEARFKVGAHGGIHQAKGVAPAADGVPAELVFIGPGDLGAVPVFRILDTAGGGIGRATLVEFELVFDAGLYGSSSLGVDLYILELGYRF